MELSRSGTPGPSRQGCWGLNPLVPGSVSKAESRAAGAGALCVRLR
jgi:hypothetical protein